MILSHILFFVEEERGKKSREKKGRRKGVEKYPHPHPLVFCSLRLMFFYLFYAFFCVETREAVNSLQLERPDIENTKKGIILPEQMNQELENKSDWKEIKSFYMDFSERGITSWPQSDQ